ncbi:ABC transporter permease [Paenibacillus psychroresistens]|uniref:ABC transporter permease n=1 Tax=Paenibacillus psychroresistens TaxID=1778678 RepID=A0A6B8RA61_9BACL|nr:ABC transporter permease [Paenibacillus psychroresistens]QGQ93671.1 ABC transporter permease [Paenibacillus psychroresistens]
MKRIEHLWFARCAEFWKEALQYGSYVARSGFTAFLFGIFIVGIYFYNKVLETLPTSFPYAWITTPVILLALVISPIRTFIKTADAVFLLPAEKQMNDYFRKSWIYSFMIQSAFVIIACLAVWPLYRHCLGESKEPLWALLLFLLLNKALHSVISWQEGRMVYKRHRDQLKVLRWLLTLIIVYSLFVYGLLLALAALLLSSCIIWITLRGTPLHTINWDHLIKTEQKHLAAHYLFYSWFIDVPQRVTPPKHRALWSQWTKLYAFLSSNTFLYLYTKTLLRSELFGIIQRLTLLGLILLITTPNVTAKIIIYGIVIFISTVQTSSLDQQHRYSFWLLLYPLQPEWRTQALAKILFSTTAFQSLLLTITLLCVNVSFLLAVFCLSLSWLLCALYSFVIYPRKLRRRLF